MKDMDKAVKESNKLLQMKNAYFWDYDVDGTTAVSLVSSLFKKSYYPEVANYIPDRYDDMVFHLKELIMLKTMVLRHYRPDCVV
jgi:single-stranded DNA-specific DHH superfamily exonuclease